MKAVNVALDSCGADEKIILRYSCDALVLSWWPGLSLIFFSNAHPPPESLQSQQLLSANPHEGEVGELIAALNEMCANTFSEVTQVPTLV